MRLLRKVSIGLIGLVMCTSYGQSQPAQLQADAIDMTGEPVGGEVAEGITDRLDLGMELTETFEPLSAMLVPDEYLDVLREVLAKIRTHYGASESIALCIRDNNLIEVDASCA